MRIRRRLALLGTALAAGTILVFAALLVLLVGLTGPRDRDTALDKLATSSARDYVAGSPSPALLVDLATSLDPVVVVTDRTGQVVYAQGRVGDRPPDVPRALVEDALARGSSTATVTVRGVELRMLARARADGAAVAVQQTKYLSSQRAGIWGAGLVAAVFTAIAGAVASWVVTGRALRPLRTLERTAAEVARTGDLSRRLDVPARGGEVASLAREFNAMMDRLAAGQAWLAAALERQKSFVADASHELRTPLSTIRANAGFLAERPDADPADRAEAVEDVRAEADRMARLVDDLLVLARTDSLPEPVRRPVDLGALAADVARLAGVAAEHEPAPGAPPGQRLVVLGDEEMLRRALRALVDNALLHGGTHGDTGQQGAAGVVVRTSVAEGRWAVLSVRDHGPGFPPDAVNRVFERFYRADPARSGPGSGLGLAIVAAVSRLHGGGVTASNAPDGGAVVTVHLPAA